MVSDALLSIEGRMRASVSGLRKELTTLRTGRATPALVEYIRVDYAGVPTPIHQIAGISVPEASLLIIQPWDKSSIREIEKAILKSDLGFNPTNDGNVIRISIPPLSEERRQELTRVVRKRIEERKIVVRNLRHEVMNDLKTMEKNKEMSEDEHKRALSQLQKLTDAFIAEIDQTGRDKEKELLEA
jgi:ribosome recycling factor